MSPRGKWSPFRPWKGWSEFVLQKENLIRRCAVSSNSEIAKHLAGAQLFDAFELPANPGNRSALEIYIDIMAQTPDWVNCLMAARNRAVALFGLKNLGPLDNVDTGRKPESYRVGDRIGIFSILFLSDREVILIESDKHLDAKVSLCKRTTGPGNSAVMTTVIHLHNFLGRAYILLVWPLHKLIVPSLLARSARRRHNS